MAVESIEYTDKEQGQPNDEPIAKQWRYLDANEVKDVVNNNATELTAVISDVSTNTLGLAAVVDDVTTLSEELNEKADKGQVGSINWLIASPSDEDYTIWLKAPIGGTITETTTKSDSGTCTATFKIEGAALSGTANSVSSTEESQAHSSAFAEGETIALTVSSNSTCVNMSFTIKYTYNLA